MPPRGTRRLLQLLSESSGSLPGRACGAGPGEQGLSVLSYAVLRFLGGAAHIWGFANVRGLLSTQVPSLDFPSQEPQKGSPRTRRTGPPGSGAGPWQASFPWFPELASCARRSSSGTHGWDVSFKAGRSCTWREAASETAEASVISRWPPGPRARQPWPHYC